MPKKVLRIKITLKDTKPPVWRRILVSSDSSFWDLHVAIQDAMGWMDCHLHQFEVFNRRWKRETFIGIPDDEFESGREMIPGWTTAISRYLNSTNPKVMYIYDFGDDWEHSVVLEKALPADDGPYPRCIGGRRRCPPEDCGGPPGYEEFLRIIGDKTHEQREDMLEWVGGHYDPDEFDSEDVIFDDPRERL